MVRRELRFLARAGESGAVARYLLHAQHHVPVIRLAARATGNRR